MLSRKTTLRLLDIIEDAGRIATFIDGMTVNDFLADERTIFAIERLLQRVTEAAIQIVPEDAIQLEPNLPIGKMRGLGNRLRHEYGEIDRRAIFQIACVEVPLLRAAAQFAVETNAC